MGTAPPPGALTPTTLALLFGSPFGSPDPAFDGGPPGVSKVLAGPAQQHQLQQQQQQQQQQQGAGGGAYLPSLSALSASLLTTTTAAGSAPGPGTSAGSGAGGAGAGAANDDLGTKFFLRRLETFDVAEAQKVTEPPSPWLQYQQQFKVAPGGGSSLSKFPSETSHPSSFFPSVPAAQQQPQPQQQHAAGGAASSRSMPPPPATSMSPLSSLGFSPPPPQANTMPFTRPGPATVAGADSIPRFPWIPPTTTATNNLAGALPPRASSAGLSIHSGTDGGGGRDGGGAFSSNSSFNSTMPFNIPTPKRKSSAQSSGAGTDPDFHAAAEGSASKRKRHPLPAGMNQGKWSTEEHNLFVSLLDELGSNWVAMSARLGNRTKQQCRSHAQKYWKRLKEKGGAGDGGGGGPSAATSEGSSPRKRARNSEGSEEDEDDGGGGGIDSE